jgi:probable F420-dependent oxidoreductase
MRLGIVTPIVNLNPRFKPPEWEETGRIDDIVAVAQVAEQLGYEWLGCPEHIAIPDHIAATRGGRYWDPVATLGFVAGRTSIIRLLSHVTVLGYHHPLEIVKRYGTLDEASGGRVILGVGVGSLREEFDLVGATFENRGEIADDALRAIRASFGQRHPKYDGPHFSIAGFVVDPCGVQEHVPIWVGGRTRRSLRRAVELGDGWIPFGLTAEELRSILTDPKAKDSIKDRGWRFSIVLSPEPPLDPVGQKDSVTRVVTDYEAMGATALALRFHHTSRQHYLEQLSAMRDIVHRTVGIDRVS